MTEPVSFADLTSEKGWAKVDYRRTLWIPCPAAMPDGYDTSRWAREFSGAWWSMSGLPHGETELTRLETQLAYIRDNTYGHLPCHMAFIHLPDPRLDPLPVYLAVLAARGEHSARLRMLAGADDPSVIQPPITEAFSTDRLGTGLRALRHFTDSPEARPTADGAAGGGATPEIYAGLGYAWRSAEYETDLRLFTASPDLSRLQGAISDIDELARGVSVITPVA
jgi:hypothetical protein